MSGATAVGFVGDHASAIGTVVVIAACAMMTACVQQPGQSPSAAEQSFAPSRESAHAVVTSIGKNWTVSSDEKGVTPPRVRLVMELDLHYAVVNAYVDAADIERYKTDPAFRSAADAGIRAVKRASPLPLPPAEFTPATYDKWHFMSMDLDPQLTQ